MRTEAAMIAILYLIALGMALEVLSGWPSAG